MSLRVLFVCTGNSARSQMAEGWLRSLGGTAAAAFSAGSAPAPEVHPLAVRVMAEVGISLEGQHPKHLRQYLGEPFEYVITVCDQAREACPVFPGAAYQLHWSFPDPAAVMGTEEERLAAFRRVRDDLAAQLRAFLKEALAPSVRLG